MYVLGMIMLYYLFFIFFFFKQKTAYEMRSSDWSSDVCSSDLARRTNQVFVLDGSRNLAFTAAGPKSAFGNRWLLPQPLGEPSHVQGIRIQLRTGDRSFTFTNDSILEWSEPIGGWKIIALIPQIIEPYRWTAGYLNGVIYFCHPRTGILEL